LSELPRKRQHIRVTNLEAGKHHRPSLYERAFALQFAQLGQRKETS
jgi:hypothetical protein